MFCTENKVRGCGVGGMGKMRESQGENQVVSAWWVIVLYSLSSGNAVLFCDAWEMQP